jgi:hypothetical protein
LLALKSEQNASYPLTRRLQNTMSPILIPRNYDRWDRFSEEYLGVFPGAQPQVEESFVQASQFYGSIYYKALYANT